jgi:hypothetical protein
MKRSHLLILVFAFVAAIVMAARAAEPGSKDDPIVTRSYLDTLYAWQQTPLSAGQSLSLDLGVLFVVRRGQVNVAGTNGEGLVDLTAGKELADGEAIPPNHLVMSPASDRRGIKAGSAAMLLTKGLQH